MPPSPDPTSTCSPSRPKETTWVYMYFSTLVCLLLHCDTMPTGTPASRLSLLGHCAQTLLSAWWIWRSPTEARNNSWLSSRPTARLGLGPRTFFSLVFQCIVHIHSTWHMSIRLLCIVAHYLPGHEPPVPLSLSGTGHSVDHRSSDGPKWLGRSDGLAARSLQCPPGAPLSLLCFSSSSSLDGPRWPSLWGRAPSSGGLGSRTVAAVYKK